MPTSSSDISSLQSQLTTIQSDATALVNSAKSDFPSETSAIKSSVDTLSSAVKALPSSPSTSQIAAIAVDVAAVTSSVKSFTTPPVPSASWVTMSSGRTTRARRSLGKGRMEAFSDGVFAIAITLLVLDFAIHPPGSPLHQVLHIWPSFVAYLVSFLTIGAAWLGHTALTDRLERTDSIFLRLNLLLLLVVTFLPFPTGLVGEALREPSSERVFVTMYGLTLLAIRLMGFALDEYADREHLYAQSERRRGAPRAKTDSCPSSPRM